MVEVIIRKLEKVEEDGTEVWKVKKKLSKYFGPGQVQVSLNSDGHLVVRLQHAKFPMDDDPQIEETLIVFNIAETQEIATYLNDIIADDLYTNKTRR